MTGHGLLAIGILGFSLATAQAADDLAGGVKNLLANGAKPSANTLASARAEYKQISQRPDFDARAKYAFALVLIQQRQLTEARALLEEILGEKPEMLPAWRAKIWADLVSRSYEPALSDMRAAADQLAKVDADSSGVGRDEPQTLTRLLGQGIGFLRACEKTGIAAADLKAGREAILAKVGSDRAQFLISEQMMVSEIAALDRALEAAGHAQGAAAAKRQEMQSGKTREVGKVADQTDFDILKNNADSAAQLRSANAALDDFRLQLAKAQFDLKAIELAINTQLGQEQLQQDTIDASQRRVEAMPGAGLSAADVINAEQNLQQMANNVKQLISRRNLLLRQIADLDQKLQSALLQRNRLVLEGEATASELRTKADLLKQKEKKLEYAEKHSSQTSRGGGALRERRKSFSNFEPLAFDRETERIVGWFER